jgi:hypothetical protein
LAGGWHESHALDAFGIEIAVRQKRHIGDFAESLWLLLKWRASRVHSRGSEPIA